MENGATIGATFWISFRYPKSRPLLMIKTFDIKTHFVNGTIGRIITAGFGRGNFSFFGVKKYKSEKFLNRISVV
jgi:hypothetical protein